MSQSVEVPYCSKLVSLPSGTSYNPIYTCISASTEFMLLNYFN